MEHIDTVEGLEAALAAAKEAKQAVVVQVSGACALRSQTRHCPIRLHTTPEAPRACDTVRVHVLLCPCACVCGSAPARVYGALLVGNAPRAANWRAAHAL